MTAREVASKVRKFLKENGFEDIKVRARTKGFDWCDAIVVSLIDPEYTGTITYADGKYYVESTERGRQLLKAYELVKEEFRRRCDEGGPGVLVEINR